jgi:prepilin-type processing-associated H-X9-DG protein/prepilin-type N-terminal cleavage/methylation domain-containing protein
MAKFRQTNFRPLNGLGRLRGAGTFVSSGFSLIELVIVLALMILLTTAYWNHGMGGNRHLKACEQNLQKIHLAMEIYANDFNGQFPAATNARTSEEVLSLLVPRYCSDTAIFICPAGNDSSLSADRPFRKGKISYAYYMGRHPGSATESLMSDRQIDTQPKAAGDRVFSQTGRPPGNNHGKKGGNFLFCDGHVEASPSHAPFPLPQPRGIVLLDP